MAKEFLHNAPRWVLMRALPDADGHQYTEEEMILSLYLDVDRGKVLSLNDYARVFGIAKSTLIGKLETITEGVWNWASSYGTQPTQGAAKNYLKLISKKWKYAHHPTAVKGTKNTINGSDRQPTGNRPATDQKTANAGDLEGQTDRQPTGNRPATDRHTKTSSTSSTSKDKKNPPKSPLTVPDWIDPNVWQAWKEFREQIKAPLTSHAVKLHISKLTELRDQGHEPNSVINQSIERGWRGLFPIKADRSGNDRNHAPERDLAEAHQRNRAIARAALNLEPGGVVSGSDG